MTGTVTLTPLPKNVQHVRECDNRTKPLYQRNQDQGSKSVYMYLQCTCTCTIQYMPISDRGHTVHVHKKSIFNHVCPYCILNILLIYLSVLYSK